MVYKNQVIPKFALFINISVSWKCEWTYLGCGDFLEEYIR